MCAGAECGAGAQVGWSKGSRHLTANKEEQGFIVRHLLDVFAVLGLAVLVVLGTLAWLVLWLARLARRVWQRKRKAGKQA